MKTLLMEQADRLASTAATSAARAVAMVSDAAHRAQRDIREARTPDEALRLTLANLTTGFTSAMVEIQAGMSKLEDASTTRSHAHNLPETT